MFQSTVAISLRSGPENRAARAAELAAVWLDANGVRHDFTAPLSTPAVASPGTPMSDAVVALVEFLPETPDVLCISHQAAGVRRALLQASGKRLKLPVLDTRELAGICFPTQPDTRLEALADGLAFPWPEGRGAIGECRATLLLWGHCVAAVTALPPAFAAELAHVLGRRRNPLRELFRRAAAGTRRHRDPVAVCLGDAGGRRPALRRRAAGGAGPVLDPEEICGALGRDGPLADAVGNYEHRPEQLAMARAVTRAFNDARLLFVEAGTGVGKSLAYLLPAITWASRSGSPVVISTYTKNLQTQLYRQDLPRLLAALGLDVRTALIKGRRNYLCRRKLGYLLRHTDEELDVGERPLLASLLVWARQTETGDLAECRIGEAPTAAGLRAKVTSIGDECPGSLCTQAGSCFLRRQRAASLAADVVVANHAVVFAEMALPLSPALPPYRHVVFDEAHNLEDAATNQFSVELSWPRLRAVWRRLWRPGRRRSGGLLSVLLTQLERRAEQHPAPGPCRHALDTARDLRDRLVSDEVPASVFFATLAPFLPGGDRDTRRLHPDAPPSGWEAVQSAGDALRRALVAQRRLLGTLAEALQQAGSEAVPELFDLTPELGAAGQWLNEFVQALGFVLGLADDGYVYWLEGAPRRQGGVRAWAAPIRVGPLLEEHLYRSKDTIVFTSATLSVAGRTTFVRQRLGLDAVPADRCAELLLGTPFDYPRQCLVMAPTFLPDPGDRRRDFPAELAPLLAAVVRRTRGRTLALFTSYASLDRTSEYLRAALADADIDVLAQGTDGSRDHLTQAFKQDFASVLLGTHSFWEGVDIVGDRLSCLVITRLPFAVFTDPVVEARSEEIENSGGDAFRDFAVPNAVIRFRQGFGRLIRHREDRGVVIIADRRIVTRRYGLWFRNSLPAPVRPIPEERRLLEALDAFLAAF